MGTTFEDITKNSFETRIFPSFDGTTIDMRAESELGVSWLTNSQAVVVRDRYIKPDLIRRRCVPKGKQELLGIEYSRVRPGQSLADRVIYFEDLDIVLRETYNALRIRCLRIFTLKYL